MRTVMLTGLVLLFCIPFVAHADTEEEYQQRIRDLEGQVESLQQELEALQSQAGESSTPENSGDPLVGKWNCSNSLFNYDMSFEADGQLMQEEVFLGNARANTWRRVDSSQIVLGNGTRLRPEFESEDEFTVEPIKSGTLWRCQRIED